MAEKRNSKASRGGKPKQRREPGRSGSAASVSAPVVSSAPASPTNGTYIEGRRAAAEALRTGFPVKRALVAKGVEAEPAIKRLLNDLASANIPVKYVPRTQLDELSSHGAHQGIALQAGSFPYVSLADVIARAGDGPALVVVLDHVTDAGNFGAIVRSAEVVGAAGVVIASKRAAAVTVATFKTSAGAVMHLPIAQVPNIARALDELKEAGFWTVGASEHARDICWDTDLSGRIALVMGSEGEGISRLVLDKCDLLTKLPQLGATESLNVAQATTALCYEWLRRNYGELAPAAPTAQAGA